MAAKTIRLGGVAVTVAQEGEKVRFTLIKGVFVFSELVDSVRAEELAEAINFAAYDAFRAFASGVQK